MRDDDTFDWAVAGDRAAKHWRQEQVTWSEICEMVSGTPAKRKESGNYLLGKLRMSPACSACRKKGLEQCRVRNNRTVESRNWIPLDADYPDADFEMRVDLALAGTAYVMHTTFNSAPDDLRWRLLVPTGNMTPEQYGVAARALMKRIGEAYFDLTCDEPARYMFRPSAKHQDWYRYAVVDGDYLDVNELLDGYVDDLSSRKLPAPRHDKRDPLDLPGVVGEFNRAYQDNLPALIEQYKLPYEPSGENRWHLVGSRSQAGMGEIPEAPGLYYSYHAHDPAYGVACSAFDLVRVHRFGEADAETPPGTPINRLPSFQEMLDLAAEDPRVMEERIGELEEADATWQLDLRRNHRTNAVLPHPNNYELLAANDPALTELRYNEWTFTNETEADLPWRVISETGGPGLTETDYGKFGWYLEKTYGLKAPRADVVLIVDSAAQRRWYNPVTDYLKSLRWDGKPRVEECLPGAEVTPYTRLVARKSVVAAVARALNPGCKWDHTLVLVGPEGIGKSHWVETMSRGWFGQLGPLGHKDTLITMHRSWIVITDEAHTLRRAEADAQKEFLTRTADVFRMPYERNAISHPRRCVIWGTTNDQVFLTEQEGNRRFLVVRCERMDFERYTPEYVDQVWAEAVALYQAGERLYLTPKETRLVGQQVAEHVEEDSLFGVVQAYLDDSELPKDAVCTRELWTQALGNFTIPPKRMDLLDLFRVMQKMPGWKLLPERVFTPQYGLQKTFVREPVETSSIEDLI